MGVNNHTWREWGCASGDTPAGDGRAKRLASLYDGSAFQHRTLNEPKYRRHIDEIVYLLDLPVVDLSRFDALLIPDRIHHERLAESKDRIIDFLERGGTVIALGERPNAWLPGVRWEHRPTNFWWWLEPKASSGLVLNRPDHSLFRYITLDDATWHQHGVFWPPDGVETVISMEDGGVVLYVDRVSTPGTLVVTCLDPIAHFGSYFMPATERFLDGFLPWVREELLGDSSASSRAF